MAVRHIASRSGRPEHDDHDCKGPLAMFSTKNRSGKIKYALLGWLLGLPLPIVLILLFVRGCDF